MKITNSIEILGMYLLLKNDSTNLRKDMQIGTKLTNNSFVEGQFKDIDNAMESSFTMWCCV
jgi:hypothetical protein